MFFSYPPRNLKPELLDLDEAAFDEVRDSLEDIRLVNKYLGGYKVLLHYFQKLAKRQRLDKEFSVLDLGTGTADQPVAVVDMADPVPRSKTENSLSNLCLFASFWK
jgi:hypothetical protein